jgi:multiple sugar transport system substrate-binding protein
MMAKGRVSMEPRPSNQLGTFETLLDAQVDVIGLPAGLTGPGNVMLPAGLALYAKSPNQEIGAQFLSFWVNDTEAAVTYKADQGVPGVAAQRDALLASPEMPGAQRRVFELFGQLDFASMSPMPANVAEFITIFQAGYQPVGFGTSPTDAAAQVFAQLPASFK